MKRKVEKEALQLQELTVLLSQEQSRIDRQLILLHIIIILSILILIVHYGGGNEHSHVLLLFLPVLTVLSLSYKSKLKRFQKRYDNIYHNSYTLMVEFTHLIEWTDLNDSRDMIIIDNYITTIERMFCPHRSLLNYYVFYLSNLLY